MPLKHKFLHELGLELIDYKPETLIVGTFYPDLPGADADAWFYDHPAYVYLWNVLPRLYGQQSLADASSAERRQFCRDNRIAFTDLISAIDDADPANPAHVKILSGFTDKAIEYNFDDFDFEHTVQLLQRRPEIKRVYLTRGVTEAFWRHLWNPVMQYCSRNNIHERRLWTPAGNAVYQHEAYNKEHPENQLPLLEDYILMRWREEWHF